MDGAKAGAVVILQVLLTGGLGLYLDSRIDGIEEAHRGTTTRAGVLEEGVERLWGTVDADRADTGSRLGELGDRISATGADLDTQRGALAELTINKVAPLTRQVGSILSGQEVLAKRVDGNHATQAAATAEVASNLTSLDRRVDSMEVRIVEVSRHSTDTAVSLARLASTVDVGNRKVQQLAERYASLTAEFEELRSSPPADGDIQSRLVSIEERFGHLDDAVRLVAGQVVDQKVGGIEGRFHEEILARTRFQALEEVQ